MPPAALHQSVNAVALSHMGCSRPGAPGTLMSAMTDTSTLELVTPVAVAPVAEPGPHTLPRVPKVPDAEAPAWLLGLVEPLEFGLELPLDPDDPHAARARTDSAASAASLCCLCLILRSLLLRIMLVSLTSCEGPSNARSRWLARAQRAAWGIPAFTDSRPAPALSDCAFSAASSSAMPMSMSSWPPTSLRSPARTSRSAPDTP